MEYILREHSVLTSKNNLESLYTFKDFPVFMGCTNELSLKDIRADMSFAICRDTGIIQLNKLLPLDLVYQNQHNDGIGKIWQDHYRAFSQFLDKFSPKKILEIGGSHDFIANDFLARSPDTRWIVIEPHPLFESSDKIRVVKGWFDNNFTLDEQVDTIIHSHVFEHTYDPLGLLRHISNFLETGGKHIFTFPNMIEMLSKKYTNCLNFEHTVFLAEPFVDVLLHNHGFQILEKEYYQDHSIFYATEKVEMKSFAEESFPNKYKEYRNLFFDFINYHQNIVKNLNEEIANFDGEVYIFGAHVFTQYLFAFGLDQTKIVSLLDNSDLKKEKRLYGTNLIVHGPEILKDKEKVGVVLKVGIYRDEILKQLKEINPEVVIFE